MTGMILHCGAKQVELKDVLDVVTPEPTRTHVPIPHGWLLEQANASLEACDLEVSDWSYALNAKGAQMFAMARIRGDLTEGRDEGVIALRNAHDKVYKAGFAYGRRVFCCDNLGFSGEVTIGRKHTPGIIEDLPDLLWQAAGHLVGFRDIITAKYDTYMDTPMTDEEFRWLMFELINQRMVPDLRSIQIAAYEWQNPSYIEFAEQRNVWRAFNAVTESFKETGLPNPGRTMRLHSIADQFCGIESAEDAEIVVQ